MRDLATNIAARIADRTTEPGGLIEILFAAGPYQRTSFGVAVPWHGNTWSPVSLRVEGLSADIGKPGQVVTFHIGNADATIGALCLSSPGGGRGSTVNYWTCYTPTPDDADPVQLFSGAIDSVQLGADLQEVRIRAQTIGLSLLKSPREFMTREAGFANLTPEGTVITFGSETFTLQRGD